MDDRLRKSLLAIEKQIKRLKSSEEKFLTLEASKKTKYAIAYLTTSGTVAERESTVYCSPDWMAFSSALVTAEVEFNFEKRRLEHHMKCYDGEHLSFKIEGSAITRQGSIT